MISLVGVNQTVGHNYVVFPSISPSKLSLLRRVSLATELSCAPVCACVRRCLNVKMRNPAFTCYRSVCHIQLSVTHQWLQQCEGELRPHPAHNINGGRCLLLWHSSIIMYSGPTRCCGITITVLEQHLVLSVEKLNAPNLIFRSLFASPDRKCR